MGKANLNTKKYRAKLEIVAIIISVLAIIVSMVTGIIVPIWQQNKEHDLATELRIKEAIPAFRIVHNKEASDIMEIFPPHRQLQSVQDDTGNIVTELYYSIKDFSIQNLSNNLAYFSHIEFGGEAFELVNLGLVAKENEVISLSNSNKFIGYGPYFNFYIICRSIYGKYYKYECLLNADTSVNGVYIYTVDYIGSAEEYDINNEVYKNMYKHVRDIQVFPPNVAF